MNLTQILMPDENTRQIYLLNSAVGRIQVFKNHQHTWMTIDDVVQSAIQNEAPYRTVLPHNIVMMLPLIHDRVPNSVLELGGGAQSNQRFLKACYPNLDFTSVELNKDVIEASNQYFPLAEKMNIVQQDAFEYVAQCVQQKKQFDWILVDLFKGADSPVDHAPHAFFDQLKKCLSEQGWLIINCLNTTEKIRHELSDKLAHCFDITPHRLPVPDMLNQIFMLRKDKPFIFPPDIEKCNLNGNLPVD